MSVRLEWNEPYGLAVALTGAADVDSVCGALEQVFPEGGAVGPMMVLDLTDFSGQFGVVELHQLTDVLAPRAPTIWLRTADVAGYGMARQLRTLLAEEGVKVRIEHLNPGVPCGSAPTSTATSG